MANPEGYTEQVIPDDGRRESGWVLASILLILALGSLGIANNQSVPVSMPGHLLLSVGDKATLTALRNAGDEIQFMRTDAEPLPSIEQLMADGIPPFASVPGRADSHRWSLQVDPSVVSGGCYQGVPLAEQGMAFLLTFDAPDFDAPDADKGVAVHWRALSESDSLSPPHPQSHPQHAGHDHADAPGSCQPDTRWQEFSNA